MHPPIKVIACRVVVEELAPFLREGVETLTLDFGLHRRPEGLRAALQEAVDGADPRLGAVVLGYGMCSGAVVGLRAGHCPLVVPRVDDCISIFLGSRAEHRRQHRAEPGTYYLTKGWVEAGDGPFAEYERVAERWGAERAGRVMGAMLKHYTRLAFIRTGSGVELGSYRAHAQATAARFGLRYDELEGSPDLVRRLVQGPWDEGFVVVPPGESVPFEAFCGDAEQQESTPPPERPRPVTES